METDSSREPKLVAAAAAADEGEEDD